MVKIDGATRYVPHNPERTASKKVTLSIGAENADNTDSVVISEDAKKKHVMGQLLAGFRKDFPDIKPRD